MEITEQRATAVVIGDGHAIVGEDAIRVYLDERFADPPQADARRIKVEGPAAAT